MIHTVGSVGAAGPTAVPLTQWSLTEKPAVESAPSFQDLLIRSFDEMAVMEQQAQTGVLKSLTTGADLTQVEALSALKKADLALRLMLQVRNKILEAYQEIQQMRM